MFSFCCFVSIVVVGLYDLKPNSTIASVSNVVSRRKMSLSRPFVAGRYCIFFRFRYSFQCYLDQQTKCYVRIPSRERRIDAENINKKENCLVSYIYNATYNIKWKLWTMDKPKADVELSSVAWIWWGIRMEQMCLTKMNWNWENWRIKPIQALFGHWNWCFSLWSQVLPADCNFIMRSRLSFPIFIEWNANPLDYCRSTIFYEKTVQRWNNGKC